MNENKVDKVTLQTEVPLIEAETVRQVRTLSRLGWGAKRIASELGISRNTARRYIRDPAVSAGVQARPAGRRLDQVQLADATRLWAGEGQGNAVVVHRLLQAVGYPCGLRTVQRAVQPERAKKRRAEVATVRYETEPGAQMQIDFGQKVVNVAGRDVKVYLFVAVLGFSRRIFVRAGLSERQEDWQEGIAAAFKHFGGSTRTLLIDNPRAMVLMNKANDTGGRDVTLHPAFAGFLKDWDVTARACQPYRARTKGKVESGVKYVKRNALAGLSFVSFEALQAHICAWMHEADRRVHGTTKQVPAEVFAAQEAAALTPLPQRPCPARTRRLKRKVANDSFVSIDTVRYSVPHQLVRESVFVEVGDTTVRVYFDAACVATHARCHQPHTDVTCPEHYEGLLRGPRKLEDQRSDPTNAAVLSAMGRSLAQYGEVVQGAAL